LRYRWLVLAIPLLCGGITVILTLSATREWSASATFIPQIRGSSGGGLSGLAAQFGVSVPTGELTHSPAFYEELLRSRAILGAVVDSTVATDARDGKRGYVADLFEIQQQEPAKRRHAAIIALNNHLEIRVSTKTGIVQLTVRAPTSSAAFALTDRLVTELIRFNLTTRRTQASAERRFTEIRLADAEANLRRAEDALRRFVESNRAFISPALEVERDRLRRAVTHHQEVYSSLEQAFERARIDEVRDTPVINVLDRPEPPVSPNPHGLVGKTVASLIGGGLLAVVLALLLHANAHVWTTRASEVSQ
jgi:uncharacterized protein involved in exopolysaccharide biosynthesis